MAKEKQAKNLLIEAGNEANLATACRAYALVNELLASFPTKSSEILVIFTRHLIRAKVSLTIINELIMTNVLELIHMSLTHDLKSSIPYASPQTEINSYQKAIRLFWKELYATGGKAIYSQQQFGPVKPGWINIEHIFPMAWVVNALKCKDRRDCRYNRKQFNFIESDLHNLYPSRRDLNMLRASHRFGKVKGELRLFGSFDFKLDNKRRIIEPAPASQGEVARSMYHMATTYNLKIFAKQAETLAYWNKVDQPSKEEMRRNDLIEALQGTRNIFIDDAKKIEQAKNKFI